jgi:hypothetical protein
MLLSADDNLLLITVLVKAEPSAGAVIVKNPGSGGFEPST